MELKSILSFLALLMIVSVKSQTVNAGRGNFKIIEAGVDKANVFSLPFAN